MNQTIDGFTWKITTFKTLFSIWKLFACINSCEICCFSSEIFVNSIPFTVIPRQADYKFSFLDTKGNKSFLFFFFTFTNILNYWTVPRVEIVDERGLRTSDKFYKSGSTIELKCVISKIPQPTSYVTWKHGLRTLNYDTSRGGIR